MKSIIHNPTLQKIIVCLLLVVLFVVLFWPSPFVSDELLSQIKPGMTVETAKYILGNPWPGKHEIWGPTTPHGGFVPQEEDWRDWKWESASLGLRAIAPDGSHPINRDFQHLYWVSEKRMLLWVEAQDGVIVHAWVLPLKKSPRQ